MMYPPSAQFLVPGATTRKYTSRPLPFRPPQNHDRNGNFSLRLSNTSIDCSQRTNKSSTKKSSTKVSKRGDIVETRVLSESENISDHTPPNGISSSSYTYSGSC